MKGKLVRLLLVLATLAIVSGIGYGLRLLMISELTFHSFWHYVTRFFLVSACIFTVILLIQSLTARNPAEALGVSPSKEPSLKFSNILKRMADIVLATILLTLFFPVLVVTSLAIFVFEGYPVFYISRRYISLDQCVSIWKFRTMVRDATEPRYRLRERFMRDGFLDIPLDCEVYTPIGRFLERTQVVEILQLFNVLVHGMSLIGNRPLPRENVLLLQKFKGWEARFDSPAGLTGLSQVVGKLNQDPQGRLRLEGLYSNLYRAKGGNVLLCDLYIAYYTVRLLLFRKTLSVERATNLVSVAPGD